MTDSSITPPQLVIRRNDDARGAVLELHGEFDLSSVEEVQGHLSDIATEQPQRLLLDLSGLEFMDSSGLRVLIELRQACQQSGRELVLRQGQRQVQRLFDISGLAAGFTFEP